MLSNVGAGPIRVCFHFISPRFRGMSPMLSLVLRMLLKSYILGRGGLPEVYHLDTVL